MRTSLPASLLAALLLAAWGASLGQAPAPDPVAPKAKPSKPVAGLQITLDRAAHGVLEVTLQNVEKKPMVLNLGVMLGNGLTLIPNHLHLTVTGASGKSRQLAWKGSFVGGRMDDFLVPLMASAKYTVILSLDDFTDDNAKPALAAGDKVQIGYEGAAASGAINAAIPNLPIWKEKVESSPITYAD